MNKSKLRSWELEKDFNSIIVEIIYIYKKGPNMVEELWQLVLPSEYLDRKITDKI